MKKFQKRILGKTEVNVFTQKKKILIKLKSQLSGKRKGLAAHEKEGHVPENLCSRNQV